MILTQNPSKSIFLYISDLPDKHDIQKCFVSFAYCLNALPQTIKLGRIKVVLCVNHFVNADIVNALLHFALWSLLGQVQTLHF